MQSEYDVAILLAVNHFLKLQRLKKTNYSISISNLIYMRLSVVVLRSLVHLSTNSRLLKHPPAEIQPIFYAFTARTILTGTPSSSTACNTRRQACQQNKTVIIIWLIHDLELLLKLG